LVIVIATRLVTGTPLFIIVVWRHNRDIPAQNHFDSGWRYMGSLLNLKQTTLPFV
jgi:hypothetical protein